MMMREQLIRFAATSAIGLGLILAPSPGFAGISNFSVNSPATFVPGSNKQVIVTGTVGCTIGKEITIGLQMVQQRKMAAFARGEFRQQCTADAIITWQITASSAVSMQTGISASVLAGAWACLPPASGPRPTGPCEFALFSGDIMLK